MKAAVFYGKNDLRVQEVGVPAVGPEDVLIRVMACGVCGTDVHIFEGAKGAAEVTPPTILGHEFAGHVEEVGSAVTKCKVGDKVCVDPNVMCGRCYYCRSGIGHFCENMSCIGTKQDGGFAEYASVNQKAVHLLSEDTTFEQGAMAEPIACCLNGIDMCEIRPGSVVAVLGGGMIGLLMLQLARLAGASRIVLIEPVESKRALGKKLGATLCIDPFKEDVIQTLEKSGYPRLDVVIECVGAVSTMKQAIDIAGNKSTVMLFGLTGPDDELTIKPYSLFLKEVSIKTSYINPYTQERAVELINSGAIDVSSMVCEPIPLEKLRDALSDMEMRKQGKWIVRP